MTIRAMRRGGAASLLALLAAGAVSAQTVSDRGLSYTLYGTPGLIETPSALSAKDGQIAATVGAFDGQTRTTFTFQLLPNLSGSFRYTRIEDYTLPGQSVRDETYFDRSFDLRYRFNDETATMPAVAIGLQDFLGTGAYGAEYLVATKTFGDALRVSAGLGWGRLGSHGGFDNPLGVLSSDFDTRPGLDFGEGGTFALDQLFRGDAALFGGVEYAPSETLTLKVEYSSDAYDRESELGLIERDSPLNFGAVYRPLPGVQLGASWLYGSELALTGTFLIDPTERPYGPGLDPAPVPVRIRDADARAAQSWDRTAIPEATIGAALQQALAAEGVELSSIQLSDRAVRLRYTNTRYRSEAQAMGRIARMLSLGLPASIEQFTLEPMQRGVPLSAVTLSRSDIENFADVAGGTAALAQRRVLDDAGSAAGLAELPRIDDRFSWGIAPYGRITVFDSDAPFQLELGAQLTASYEITDSLVASGTFRQQLYTNREDPELVVAEEGEPHPVRRNAALYAKEGTTGIRDLTLAHYGRLAPDVYTRATLGYLEEMYGGASTEVLWKPADSRLGLGAEVNYAKQRDFDLGLGFQDYDVVTGHASAYYDFDNRFYGQVDVGRYLAGDWGATFILDREFENGWSVGGYFTLTDLPFEAFGEGSFDKGIRVSIPLDYVVGQPTRREASSTLASLQRDGGARLRVDGRLYEVVRDGHLNDLDDGWGRFWK
ncbi:YjbH domain-containing protein [Limimaricola variabilis]|uniref:YjbH domain-containing protein n=1 Tax=Limimaricola variabilis TaxID=1492771 RepID=UPI002AC898FF|nr:YjbH domain-containing protein [Limimaricola variabilis]WPY93540.1 YjbH domain-containing protein [Limimaricola variabilis]